MSKTVFQITFKSDEPLQFFSTSDVMSNDDWMVYFEYLLFAKDDEEDGKDVSYFTSSSEKTFLNNGEDGVEIGLMLIDDCSHSSKMFDGDSCDSFLENFSLEDYSSIGIQKAQFWCEHVEWNWYHNEGDQWAIEGRGDLICVAEGIDIENLKDFIGEFGFVGISLKTSGDDDPLTPTIMTGWDIGEITELSESEQKAFLE